MENKAKAILDEVNKVIMGKREIIRKVWMAILSGGHILMEDVPGVGKTTMALAFSRSLGLSYRRIQFTPDVMPSDVTGFYYYDKEAGTFSFREGAVMTNLLLADEINRTSSRTQSALLEVMEEGQVTVDGVTRTLPDPFIVFATQNPVGSSGTMPLPESQLDRFAIQLSMGYPGVEDEVKLLAARGHSDPIDQVSCVITAEELLAMREEVNAVKVSPLIYEYVALLAEASRKHEMVRLGVSPRGSLALVRMCKAGAYLAGRDYVVPEDVQDVIVDVYRHRLILHSRARLSDHDAVRVTREICGKVRVPDKR